MPLKRANCIILHGCPGTENEAASDGHRKHWMEWLERELVLRGLPTERPSLPKPWSPDYELFKEEFEKQPLDRNTIIIAHSCSCAFIVRWLGENKKEIQKLILVAPWKIPDEGDNDRQKFYTYEVDKTIKDRVGEITIFTSDNEDEDGKKSAKIFHNALGGTLIELEKHGHYTLNDMKTEEFPELIEVVLQ